MMTTLVAVLCLTIGGMAGWAISMERHYSQWTRGRFAPWVYRSGGSVLLLGALLLCLSGWSLAIGIIVWSGQLALGVLAVAGYLAYGKH